VVDLEEGFQSTDKLIKVAVTGPESTGKSTLACILANHYQTLWVPEYARDYLDKLNRPYTFNDVEKIAREQVALEDKLRSDAKNLLICDTELIVIKIWMEYKYHQVPDWIVSEIKNRKYDIYLLCNIDIPWEPDPQRENPGLREFFFNWFKKEVDALKGNCIIISGDQQHRTNAAINAIDILL
jgi:NadR type nicotinamide-nucleotide adenylyltransferase